MCSHFSPWLDHRQLAQVQRTGLYCTVQYDSRRLGFVARCNWHVQVTVPYQFGPTTATEVLHNGKVKEPHPAHQDLASHLKRKRKRRETRNEKRETRNEKRETRNEESTHEEREKSTRNVRIVTIDQQHLIAIQTVHPSGTKGKQK